MTRGPLPSVTMQEVRWSDLLANDLPDDPLGLSDRPREGRRGKDRRVCRIWITSCARGLRQIATFRPAPTNSSLSARALQVSLFCFPSVVDAHYPIFSPCDAFLYASEQK